jgi:tetratricopeptide (TPR) repeat protein
MLVPPSSEARPLPPANGDGGETAPRPSVGGEGTGTGNGHGDTGNGHAAPGNGRLLLHRDQPDLPAVTPAAPLDAKDAARAHRLVARGRALYAKGEYDDAEEVLKEAVTLHPFIAEANLALGKIFLIRGSALRDRAMINSARLMFEMARALDPDMREAAVLLQLFLAAPPE